MHSLPLPLGMLHTAGLYERRDVRGAQDADAMALMRKAGAIPFALTNVSEVCICIFVEGCGGVISNCSRIQSHGQTNCHLPL